MVAPVSPNLNACAERFIQSARQECLDHFVVLGRRHLDHIVREYVTHYNTERPHQGRANLPLSMREQPAPPGPTDAGSIVCRERLGGLLRHYERRAA